MQVQIRKQRFKEEHVLESRLPQEQELVDRFITYVQDSSSEEEKAPLSQNSQDPSALRDLHESL